MLPRDPLVERIAAAQDAARARAARLSALVPVAAATLRARGATRVVLFGSLATGTPPHAETDVDLAVTGLEWRALDDLTMELEALVGAKVDLVALDRCSERLRERVARDGVEI